jgi:epoxyqueuosine reductase
LYDPKALRDSVEAEARRLGFELFGVTSPDPPPHLPVFEAWLEAGRHGTMEYLATERARARRANPRQILPECKSILVVGWRYATPSPTVEGTTAEADFTPGPSPMVKSAWSDTDLTPGPSPTSKIGSMERGAKGRVASYAWGQDYHDVLPERLKTLVDFIEAQTGKAVPNRWYTDTGPGLERDLAIRAGLGWIGKNTCLIHPQHGSYFLLAEVLLGVELAADPPFVDDRCGTCTRCLDACPTGCILPDRTIDARRCISYLTIELKDAIPLELRSQMGDWVFGCDACQQACPWNRHAQAPPEQAPALAAPDLAGELALTPEAFNSKFKGSPVKRAKRRGYLRNVAVALGNTGGPEAVPALSRALLTEPEALVRRHAAWALGNLGGVLAFNTLSQALDSEPDPDVRSEIEMALEQVKQEMV